MTTTLRRVHRGNRDARTRLRRAKPRSAVRRSAIVLVVMLAVYLSPSATARLIFDRDDPAFAGATVVPLTASNLGVTPGIVRSVTTVQNGVRFDFATTAPGGMFPAGGGVSGMPILDTPRQGVTIDITPPVAAIGFQFVIAECFGEATFISAAGSEQFATAFGQRNVFVAAAEIGDIRQVTLRDPCASAAWSEMRFVPSTGTPPPTAIADLTLQKSVAGGPPPSPTEVQFAINVTNLGPDPAVGPRVVDFLPPAHSLSASAPTATLDASGTVATIPLASTLGSGSSAGALVTVNEPPFGRGLFCESVTTNVALATASSIDPNAANNVGIAVKFFDKTSRAGFAEVCDNGIDDNCDGRVDCFDFSCGSAPNCVVPDLSAGLQCDTGLVPIPGLAIISQGVGCAGFLFDTNRGLLSTTASTCDVPVIRRDGSDRRNIRIPAFCCDPPPPDPLLENSRRGQCTTSFNDQFAQLPGGGAEFLLGSGVPIDPNFKTSVPPVSFLGFGYTEAGATITYHAHYENIGTADAHDVRIIDALHPGLDETTLLIHDGGSFDPATRALTWRDPLVPPATPRSVSFSAAVRSDAAPGSKIVNIGTIIFPDAVPPSRIETNVVEHVVTKPGQMIAPDFKVARCQQTAPGSDQWRVALVNEGVGFAYDVTATIIGAPSAVHVTDGVATIFRRADDLSGAMGTVVPLAVTLSADTVGFTTQAAGDPCDTLLWRIQWRDAAGVLFPPRDVQAAADRDDDAVADRRDNCAEVNNPDQADRNGNGIGDACERDTTSPVIGEILARPGVLWPPNHKMIPVTVAVVATDDSGIAPVCHVAGVSSNEPVLGSGDGRTAPDWQITGPLRLNLRAERSGRGEARVYTLPIECQDQAGNTAMGTAAIVVPHDQRPPRQGAR